MKTLVLSIINEIRKAKGHEGILLENVHTHSDLRDDLGLDSLDMAVLTVKLEEKTSIDIFERGLITKFGDVIARLESSSDANS